MLLTVKLKINPLLIIHAKFFKEFRSLIKNFANLILLYIGENRRLRLWFFRYSLFCSFVNNIFKAYNDFNDQEDTIANGKKSTIGHLWLYNIRELTFILFVLSSAAKWRRVSRFKQTEFSNDMIKVFHIWKFLRAMGAILMYLMLKLDMF